MQKRNSRKDSIIFWIVFSLLINKYLFFDLKSYLIHLSFQGLLFQVYVSYPIHKRILSLLKKVICILFENFATLFT